MTRPSLRILILIPVLLGMAALAAGPQAAEKKTTRKKKSNGGGEPEKPAAIAKPKGPVYSKGPKSTGAIALTFDDGPHGVLTPRLLETLKKENIKATFFMLGEQVEKFPEIAKAVADAGFEIGNHTWSHQNLAKASPEEIREEIDKTQAIIEKVTGIKPRLFRPPYGNINARVHEIAREAGLDIVTWSVDPRDWQPGRTPAKLKETILQEGTGGSIVCIHDIHAVTVNTVPDIIAGLREKKLDFATAGELVDKEKAERGKLKEFEPRPMKTPATASAPAAPPEPAPGK